MEARKLIKRVLVAIGILVVVGYSYFELQGYVRGPQIEITSMRSGFSTTTEFVIVAGRITNARILALNGATTSLDIAGNFSDRLLLADGYNIINVKVVDRYGRTEEKNIEVTLVRDLETAKQITEQTATTTSLLIN